jgi:hypothetical protein
MIVLMGRVMVCSFLASAQDKSADNIQILVEKLRADKKLLVAENMQLREAEAKAFWPLYDQYQNELFRLRARTLKLIADYGEAYEQMTDNTAKRCWMNI